jgi:hypothetical protein
VVGGRPVSGIFRPHLLLAPGVQDYPWPDDDPYGERFGELYAAGDRDGLTELGVRTWAAAGADSAVREQIRGAAEIAAGIPGCQQVPAPGADHLLPLRVPDMIARLAVDLADREDGTRKLAVGGRHTRLRHPFDRG